MSNVAQKAILKAYINGTLSELMFKSTGEQVYLSDGTSVAAKIAEIVSAVNERAKKSEVTAEISEAVSSAINDLVNGAPEMYNTLKEIAEYITAHQDIVDALNAAIGEKADKSTVDTMQATLNALGALAGKSIITETDLDDALKGKINAAADSSHTHLNKDTLDGITADKVAKWDGKTKIHFSETQPEDLAEGDVWVQLI